MRYIVNRAVVVFGVLVTTIAVGVTLAIIVTEIIKLIWNLVS